MYNGLVDCFTSTYNFKETLFEDDKEKVDRTTISIPHILFDLDSENCFNDVLKLNSYCKENNYSRIIIFSGRGFHFYINVELNPDNSILDVLHYQNKLVKTLNITVDPTCIGNPSHMIRIVGTYNIKRSRWAISLREKELTSYEEIKQLAEKQRTKTYVIKGDKLKLPHQKSSDIIIDTPVYAQKSISDTNIDTKMIIPCLSMNIQPKGHIPHMERVYLTQYLSELYRKGVSVNQLSEYQIQQLVGKIVSFFEPILMDYDKIITETYVCKIVRKYEFSPSCKTLKERGLCVQGNCWRR